MKTNSLNWSTIIARGKLNSPYVGGWVLMSSTLTLALYVATLCAIFGSVDPSMKDTLSTCVQIASLCACITVTVITLAGLLTAHRMAENRRKLTEALLKVRDGDLSARVSFPSYERLSDLEEAFNSTMEVVQRKLSK